MRQVSTFPSGLCVVVFLNTLRFIEKHLGTGSRKALTLGSSILNKTSAPTAVVSRFREEI